MRAVDLERHKVVAAHANRPGRVDVGDDAALEFERRIGCIVGVGPVGLAILVDTARDMGGGIATDRLDLAEQVVQHVAPVRQHIEDHAAAVGRAIVPGGALRLHAPIAFEYPVAKFAANRQYLAEEAAVLEQCDLAQTRQI